MATGTRQRKKAQKPKTAPRRAPIRHNGKSAGKWSAAVMKRSDALDLEGGVFKKKNARQVALSLKRSAQTSQRRKSSPFRSAMSMLNFAINRGGRNLTAERRRVLDQAKVELRRLFHREPAKA
jgi:hypothetical protein